VPTPKHRAERYRKRAEEMRTAAEKMKSAEGRRSLAKLARDYDVLADRIEEAAGAASDRSKRKKSS